MKSQTEPPARDDHRINSGPDKRDIAAVDIMDPLGWLRKAPRPHCGLSAVTPNTRGRTGDNKKANYRARRAGAGQRDEYGALRAGSAYACRSRRRCYQRLIIADQNQAVGARPVRHTHRPEAEACAAACAWTQPASSTQTHSICAARLWIVDESSAAPNGGSLCARHPDQGPRSVIAGATVARVGTSALWAGGRLRWTAGRAGRWLRY